MNKLLLFFILLIQSCDYGNLHVKAVLPKVLNEVSGIETTPHSGFIWMHNDSGNKALIYGLKTNGYIGKTLKIDAENNDWEDLTADAKGNLYIGDFGNNANKRKNLVILKVKAKHLDKNKAKVSRIVFKYPDQKKFPPKNKNMYYDCEAFFHHNNYLYLFTKSRVKDDYGKTNLYKVPDKPGKYTAEYIGSFNTCNDFYCWVTGVDISNDGKQVALLSQKSVFIFSDFKNDNFFNGTVKQYDFTFESQKESICFKDSTTLYIADEKSHGKGGNLYEFYLK